jgi:hypothetical protein
MLEQHAATNRFDPAWRRIHHDQSTIALQKNVGFALLFVVAILPTLLVKIPAMEDYLDHSGRMICGTSSRLVPN